MKLDKGAWQDFQNTKTRIGDAWLTGTTDVLEKRNPELLSELNKLESVLDSLLVIPDWPTPIRKQWNDTLANYEKTAILCATYAKRHLYAVKSPSGT